MTGCEKKLCRSLAPAAGLLPFGVCGTMAYERVDGLYKINITLGKKWKLPDHSILQVTSCCRLGITVEERNVNVGQ